MPCSLSAPPPRDECRYEAQRLRGAVAVAYTIMAEPLDPKGPPKNIGEIVDRLDVLREELTMIQRSLEKMERSEGPAPPANVRKPGA